MSRLKRLRTSTTLSSTETDIYETQIQTCLAAFQSVEDQEAIVQKKKQEARKERNLYKQMVTKNMKAAQHAICHKNAKYLSTLLKEHKVFLFFPYSNTTPCLWETIQFEGTPQMKQLALDASNDTHYPPPNFIRGYSSTQVDRFKCGYPLGERGLTARQMWSLYTLAKELNAPDDAFTTLQPRITNSHVPIDVHRLNLQYIVNPESGWINVSYVIGRMICNGRYFEKMQLNVLCILYKSFHTPYPAIEAALKRIKQCRCFNMRCLAIDAMWLHIHGTPSAVSIHTLKEFDCFIPPWSPTSDWDLNKDDKTNIINGILCNRKSTLPLLPAELWFIIARLLPHFRDIGKGATIPSLRYKYNIHKCKGDH